MAKNILSIVLLIFSWKLFRFIAKKELKINTVGLIMITIVMMILSAQALMISQEYNENQNVFRSSYLLS